MTDAQPLSPEAARNIERIVRNDLKPITGNGVSITDVMILTGEDHDGDPYHHIIVIYSGTDELLDSSWLNGFKRRNRDELAKWGVNMTVESYVPDYEAHELFNPVEDED